MFYTSYWEAENLVTDVALYFSQSSPFGFSNLLTNLLYMSLGEKEQKTLRGCYLLSHDGCEG